MCRIALLALFMASAVSFQAFAQHMHGGNDKPFAGLQDRANKSLSDGDLAELRRGGGWVLALPAELNGKPGPAHLLELKEPLQLTPEQIAAIESIHAEMRAEAIAVGERLIAAEAALSEAFEANSLSPDKLRELLDATAKARAELRFIHLSRHLATPALLTATQLERYRVLRGYADDPCSNIPNGHDAAMWRKHNGCG